MCRASYNTEIMDSMRAPIQMVHDNTALTISANEASRVEDDTKRRLLANKKLSLVVDLDQTIIHATVDPTVGEWMEDKDNPNYKALSDVRPFQLVEDGPGMRGCWYYVKLRPGLESFLHNISQLYELHIYTMGTRSYAQQISNIIDPRKNLFGDRILSRDESGNLTAKNLQRLFPVDTKMVVIIDDRGDVWRWNPNLIKVLPYDFFVGIGDINSSFLPQKQELAAVEATAAAAAPPPTSAPAPASETAPQTEDSDNGATEKPAHEAKGKHPAAHHHANGTKTGGTESGTDVSALEQLVTMGGGDNPKLLQEQSDAQQETIMHQVEDRPLLQRQKELDAEDEGVGGVGGDESSELARLSAEESHELNKQRHHLLEDNDRELIYLEERLERVHRYFFDEYDKKCSRALGGRVAALRGERLPSKKDVDLRHVPDIQDIMPLLKRQVLGGVVVVFSGVLPLGTDTQNADISLWAKSFGVVVSHKINIRTTHLVAGRNRTAKVREATRYPNVKIVTTQWLLDSLTQWRHMDEEPYLLPVHPDDRGQPISPNSREAEESGWLSSSDEATGTDDDAMDDIFKSAGLTETAHIGYDEDQQAAIHEELKDFLGSDDESESDSEMDPAQQQVDEPGSSRKRKRVKQDDGDDDDNDGEEEDGEDAGKNGAISKNNEDGSGNDPLEKNVGSRLSQRIKRSHERTTGLKEVATAADTSSSETAQPTEPDEPGDNDVDVDMDESVKREAGPGPEDPAEDDDELEREMLAALEGGDYDSKAEEDIAAENG